MKPTDETKPASHRPSLHEATRSKSSRTLPGWNSRLMLAIGVALFASSAAAKAQAWATVDDIATPSAFAYAATSDSAGNLFVAGYMIEPGIGERGPGNLARGVVMKSSDGGQTWDSDPSTPDVDEPADATVPPSDYSYAGFHAIACVRTAGGEEHLVSAGRDGRVPSAPGFPSGYPLNGRWIIRRSLDAGATWSTLDQFTHPTYNILPTWTGPWGASLATSGNIYVAGLAEEYNGSSIKINHWLIRKGLTGAGGAIEWSTSDLSYPVSTETERANTYPSGVACVGSKVFVVGGRGSYWHVLKSTNNGATWTVADSYRLSNNEISHASTIAADNAGNLYVAGYGNKVSKGVVTSYWIVRKGSPDGTGWVTLDQFQYSNGNAQASAVTVDGNNNVHVTGSSWTASTPKRWITRQRSAVTGLWSTTADFSLASTGDAFGKAITADPSGNLFAAGRAYDSAGVNHGWLVRRKLAP